MAKRTINPRIKIALFCLLVVTIIAVSVWFISTLHIDMLNPKGIIALKEKNLMVFTVALGMVVIIPVFIMATIIAWRYREGNTRAAYQPNWGTNRVAESIWWGIPVTLIVILSVVTWVSTHDLDPYKPLASDAKPVSVQVVALDWKWLFIYPDYDIATVNFLQFPVNTPINLSLTADAPMNSFWIPQLSGQLYAMPGMTTKLYINATEMGDYKGSSANISGAGFAGMKFTARASSSADFDNWVRGIKQSPKILDLAEYHTLAAPSKNNPPSYYRAGAPGLYDTIVMKYMMPPTDLPAHATPTTTPHNHTTIDHNDMKDMNMTRGTN